MLLFLLLLLLLLVLLLLSLLLLALPLRLAIDAQGSLLPYPDASVRMRLYCARLPILRREMHRTAGTSGKRVSRRHARRSIPLSSLLRLGGRLQVETVRIGWELGLGDAARTAVCAGHLHAVSGLLVGALQSKIRVAQYCCGVRCHFTDEALGGAVLCIIRFRTGILLLELVKIFRAQRSAQKRRNQHVRPSDS